MVQAYIDKHHNGTLPNPYLHGKGSKIWAEYTGLNTLLGVQRGRDLEYYASQAIVVRQGNQP